MFRGAWGKSPPRSKTSFQFLENTIFSPHNVTTILNTWQQCTYNDAMTDNIDDNVPPSLDDPDDPSAINALDTAQILPENSLSTSTIPELISKPNNTFTDDVLNTIISCINAPTTTELERRQRKRKGGKSIVLTGTPNRMRLLIEKENKKAELNKK
ncbi:hypothetical protein PGB90_001380 [Kerria lacca]